MKSSFASLVVFLVATSHIFATDVSWMIGALNSNKLVLNGSVTTYATFTPSYELRFMYLGKNCTYDEQRGFSTFLVAYTGAHKTDNTGTISGIMPIADDSSLNGDQYMVALYEKATGKYFVISKTVGGAAIVPYTVANLSDDSFENSPPTSFTSTYFPTSTSGFFYKGAEIPPFCGWLASKGLVQADLTGLTANQVNLAYAVNANPTNFNGVTVSITDINLGTSLLSGTFSCTSYNSQNTPSSVAKLNGTAAFSLLASPTLSGSMSPFTGATINLSGGTFQATNGATNSTQFFQLKLNAPNIW